MKKSKPQINLKYLEETDFKSLDLDGDVEYKKIVNAEIDAPISKIEFNCCVFERVDFSKGKLDKLLDICRIQKI